MRRLYPVFAVLAPLLAFAAVTWGTVAEVTRRPTQPIDETLWLMRSRVSPADVSNPTYRTWAIDVPAVNRWLWRAALIAVDRERPGRDEKPCYEWRRGRPYFLDASRPHGMAMPVSRNPAFIKGPGVLQRWYGWTSSPVPIIAMRWVDAGFYLLMMVALWAVARLCLESSVLATAAAAPFAMMPVWNNWLAWRLTSGDVFMLALTVLALGVWLQGEKQGRQRAYLVGALIGMAISAKLPAGICLAAYLVFLAVRSKGIGRVVAPAIAFAAAVLAFCALNPGLWLDAPLQVCDSMRLILMRRTAVVAGVHLAWGVPTWTEIGSKSVFWWPVVPAAAVAVWRARRAWWWPAMLAWSLPMIFGTLGGVALTQDPSARHLLPMELGGWLLVSLCVLWRQAAQLPPDGAAVRLDTAPARQDVWQHAKEIDLSCDKGEETALAKPEGGLSGKSRQVRQDA